MSKAEKQVTERFTNRVENYIRYRPDYPEQLAEKVLHHFGLKAPNVADFGSGTGLLSRSFLDLGCKVSGIEPNVPMREAGERLLAEYAQFRSINGTAEFSTLAANSVDLIIAGQAFHWFDAEKFKLECKRISKEKTNVALIWNDRKTESPEFLAEYDAFLITHSTDYQKVNHQNIQDRVFKAFFGGEYTLLVLPNKQVFNFESLLGRVESSSYMPAKGDDGYLQMVDALRALFVKYAANDQVEILYDTKAFVAEVR